jgi:luciferase family oxidoreductase group 1
VKIGILDQVPLHQGHTAAETIDHTIELARSAERWGYRRYWFAEHHSSNGLLSAAPELWMARIGAVTKKIRIGAGGILLPQYSPLKVAELFSMLESFYPGRIDLGVGRSPGGSERAREALTDGLEKNFDAFPRQLDDLHGFLRDSLPRNHPYRIIKTTPRKAEAPPEWLLGLNAESGQLAGSRGMGLVFGHFINPDHHQETMEAYRKACREHHVKPRVIVCVFAVCAETRKEAEKLALTQDRWLAGIKKGDTMIPSREMVEKKTFTHQEKEEMHHERRRAVVGTPEDVRGQLKKLQEKYKNDEFLLITNIHGFQARRRSFELIAHAVSG